MTRSWKRWAVMRGDKEIVRFLPDEPWNVELRRGERMELVTITAPPAPRGRKRRKPRAAAGRKP